MICTQGDQLPARSCIRTHRAFAAVFITVEGSNATGEGGLFLSSAICIIVTPEILSAARKVIVTFRGSAAELETMRNEVSKPLIIKIRTVLILRVRRLLGRSIGQHWGNRINNNVVKVVIILVTKSRINDRG